MRTFQYITVCVSRSRLQPAIRSRCLALRVPSPSEQEAKAVLLEVAQREGLAVPPDALLERIAKLSQRNLRRALLMLETARSLACAPLSPRELRVSLAVDIEHLYSVGSTL